MFLKYASSGISSPLKSVSLGLHNICDEMEANCEDWDKLEQFQKMRGSCDAAMLIVDDLLAYDKIENGITNLDKKHFNPWSFLRESIRPFHFTVR